MINNILEVYREINSEKKLLKDFSVKAKIILGSLIFLILIIIIMSAIIMSSIVEMWILQIILPGLIIIPFLIIYNNARTDTIKRIYNKDSVTEFNNYKKKEFMKRTGIDLLDTSELNILMNYIQEYKEKFRTPELFRKGFLAAIFLPIWANFVARIFRKEELGLEILAYLFATTFLMIFIYFGCKSIKIILYDFLNTDYEKLTSIFNIINERYYKNMLKELNL